jgi:DNA mismatch repair protein MutS
MQLAFLPPAASPIRRQYLSLKAEHPDAILFFQLGDFYETFEDDARTVSEVCEVALTSREMGRGERLPMAGVPVHAADVYIARLVERGYHIAVCRQVEDPAAARGNGSTVVRREVVRVITPGTLVDPELLRAEHANYLAAVATDRNHTGLAYVDISTGEFACTEIDGADHADVARAELWRLLPSETLVADPLDAVLPQGANLTVDDSLFAASETERILTAHFGVASSAAVGLAERTMAALAAAAILKYLGRTQQRAVPVLDRLVVYDTHGQMLLDPATRDHLEILRGARGRRVGSLLQAMDLTRTAMGARTLARWLGRPLLDRAQIQGRLDGVETLLTERRGREQLQECLEEMPDLERLSGRAAQHLLTPREALALSAAVTAAARVHEVCPGDAALTPLVERIDPPIELAAEITELVAADPPLSFGEGVIRAGCVPELDELRSHSTDGRQWLLELERRERERTGVKNLKVGYNRVFGYYIEISIAALGQGLDYYRQQETDARTVGELLDRLGYQRRQTLASAERFVTAELRDHESKQARSAARMAELEHEAFDGLCDRIAACAGRLLAAATAIGELDTLASFAQVAEERHYVRPEIVEAPVTEIVGGRHPVVERAVGWDAYIPADMSLGRDAYDTPTDTSVAPAQLMELGRPSHVMVLTGPNMAGKTTFGRMVLLVCLLGQCGSYVPAERARLGLVDRVYLRSGAGDDITGGQSTFMVEMTETAAILRGATERSLAFFDEVGRGTSTYDGMAIARAIVEYLTEPDHACRIIFSTHYHELAAIEAERPGVCNYRMDVHETANQVFFTYRVVPGSADRSYGVHVARLAGLPGPVIARATEVLAALEAGGARESEGGSTIVPRSPAIPGPLTELAGVDVDYLTPVQALSELERLRAAALQWIARQGEET